VEVNPNETLDNQVENLKRSASWNPRGRSVAVVTAHTGEPPQLLASHIYAILWEMASVVNAVVWVRDP
jgi:hypothetical protein